MKKQMSSFEFTESDWQKVLSLSEKKEKWYKKLFKTRRIWFNRFTISIFNNGIRFYFGIYHGSIFFETNLISMCYVSNKFLDADLKIGIKYENSVKLFLLFYTIIIRKKSILIFKNE